MSVFLFSSASFFKCCPSENRFIPFWVYSQWDKLNLIIYYSQLVDGESVYNYLSIPLAIIFYAQIFFHLKYLFYL